MQFLIATAALFCALVIAKPVRLANRDHTHAVTCEIIGNGYTPIPVRECPSESCPPTGVYYFAGQFVEFDCYVESDSVENEHDAITSYYWDVNGAGYFPESYVEPECAALIDQLCE